MTKMRPPIRRRLARADPAPGATAAAVRRLSPEARAIPLSAFGYAIRLGHPYVGGEHFLLAIASSGDLVAAVLYDHGVTPERVEKEVLRLWGGGLFGDLDSDALAAIGIDVDAVRARVSDGFDYDALQRAGDRARRLEHTPWWRDGWWDPRPRRVGPGMHVNGVYLQHAPDVVQCVHSARLAAQAGHDTQIRVVHLALGLLSATDGLVPQVLAALDVSPQALRTALAGMR
jgi:Clp amino terminal domain, pathogenicity island component